MILVQGDEIACITMIYMYYSNEVSVLSIST